MTVHPKWTDLIFGNSPDKLINHLTSQGFNLADWPDNYAELEKEAEEEAQLFQFRQALQKYLESYASSINVTELIAFDQLVVDAQQSCL
ncbi:MAG: hypothetical protein ACI9JR_000160 [Gammaproteobacteria bacterium]|jgi:hypothetical protein